MKVVLLQDDKKLGKKGEVVNVSEGFAFNSLIPRGFAEPATKQALDNIERINKQKKAQEAQKKQEAIENTKKIDKKKITIKSQAKDNKLFGSITKKDIAQAISDEHNVTVAVEDVLLNEPIKELTTQEVEIDYGNDVKAGVIVTVIAR